MGKDKQNYNDFGLCFYCMVEADEEKHIKIKKIK